MRTCLFHILFICLGLGVRGQSDTVSCVRFRIVFEAEEMLQLEKDYPLDTADSIRFETLRFYVSHLQLMNGNQVVYDEPNSFHLVDMADTNSLCLPLKSAPNLRFTGLRFDLGIDSITQTAGAMAGDLDPSKGMYWTWHSGYIQLKLEGTSSRCHTAKNDFQFHLGGYEAPMNTLQVIHLQASGQRTLVVVLNLKQFIQDLDFQQQSHLMSPSENAVRLSRKVARCFKLQGL